MSDAEELGAIIGSAATAEDEEEEGGEAGEEEVEEEAGEEEAWGAVGAKLQAVKAPGGRAAARRQAAIKGTGKRGKSESENADFLRSTTKRKHSGTPALHAERLPSEESVEPSG